VFIPPLSLSEEDVMQKFQSTKKDYSSVQAYHYHLGEVFEHSRVTYDPVLHHCTSFHKSSAINIMGNIERLNRYFFH
jgi:hypothetical protein